MTSINRTGAGSVSAAALLQQIAAGKTGVSLLTGAASDATDQTDLGTQLQRGLADIVTRARQVQGAMTAAAQTERASQELQVRVREMRDLAQQATRTGLGTDALSALSARFKELQTGLNRAARTTAAAGGGTLAQALGAATGSQNTGSTPLVQITGSAAVGGNRIEEQGTALADSRVAQARGLASLQVDALDQQAVIRFTDTGNGQITATRYARTAQGLTEVGSQTVAAPGVGQGAAASGETTALRFDRLGVALTLDQGYTAGDLHGLEATVTPPAQDGGQTGQSALLDLSVADPASAQAAVARLDQLSARATALEQGMRQEQHRLGASLAEVMSGSSSSSDAAGLDVPSAQALAASLRRRLLEQTAAALQVQGNANSADVLRLVAQ